MADFMSCVLRYTLPFFITGLLLFLWSHPVKAQDPQFSQFYAAPLYLSPAFAGSSDQARFGVNYRNQWPSISANFTTMSAYFDLYLEDINSGVGALLSRDQEGLIGLQSISFALQYSYNLRLTSWLSVRPGFQVEMFYRSINFDKLTFGDQFDPLTGQVVNPVSVEGLRGGGSKFFPDLSGGALFYTKKAWLGFAAHHFTQPNQSLAGEESKLPIKLSVHAGFKFQFKPGVMGAGIYSHSAERSLTFPVLQYRHQGTFDQLDLGAYYTIEPIVLGLWYRGLPFKPVNNIDNHESIVLLIGYTMKGLNTLLNIGYSYDYTISKLGPGSGGAHEISLSYSWPTRDPRKPPKDKLILPCIDF